jgi:uroporphyrinogen-III synthase
MHLFISRPLAADSPFWQLSDILPELHITAQSLISYTAIPFDEFPPCDYLFFYSKNGVHYFFQQLAQLPVFPTLPKLATLGEGTAETLRQYTQNVDFIGCGQPQKTAENLLKIAKNQKITFVRAANSVASIRKLLENQIIAFDLYVYDNQPDIAANLQPAQILVFTSPLNISTYFEYFKAENILQKTLQIIDFVIVIGNTTAAELQKYYSGAFYVAPKPSEADLYDTLKKALKNTSKYFF